jgi:hypothetical protein
MASLLSIMPSGFPNRSSPNLLHDHWSGHGAGELSRLSTRNASTLTLAGKENLRHTSEESPCAGKCALGVGWNTSTSTINTVLHKHEETQQLIDLNFPEVAEHDPLNFESVRQTIYPTMFTRKPSLSTQPNSPVPDILIRHQPFQRFLTSIRRQSMKRKKTTLSESGSNWWKLDQHASNVSSMEFVTGTKTASISIGTTSRTFASQWSHLRSGTRSSRRSGTGEGDGDLSSMLVVDEGILKRATRRRNILDEFIRTEEGYIADLKVLVNVRMPTHAGNHMSGYSI